MASLSSSYNKFEIRKRNPNPKSSLLLVMDMQNHFSAVTKQILPTTLATIQLCRRAAIPVIFVRHCHKSPADYGMLSEWWNKDLLQDGTEGAELMPEIKQQVAGDHEVIAKSTYGAFGNPCLQERLVEMGVEEVIVCGIHTNLCCETTAREAFGRGFRVFFSADATNTTDVELHEATLKNMAHGFAYLVDCKRLEAGLFGA